MCGLFYPCVASVCDVSCVLMCVYVIFCLSRFRNARFIRWPKSSSNDFAFSSSNIFVATRSLNYAHLWHRPCRRRSAFHRWRCGSLRRMQHLLRQSCVIPLGMRCLGPNPYSKLSPASLEINQRGILITKKSERTGDRSLHPTCRRFNHDPDRYYAMGLLFFKAERSCLLVLNPFTNSGTMVLVDATQI